MENVGFEPSTVHGTIHGPGYSRLGRHRRGLHPCRTGRPSRTPSTPSPSTGRPTRSPGRWTGTSTSAGRPPTWAARPGSSTKPFFLILNLAVGGYWPGDLDGSTQFPQQLVVDSVSVTTSDSAAGVPIRGLAGKCVDVAGASSANGTPVQLYDCNGTGAQAWTVGSDGTLRALGKCLGRHGQRHGGRLDRPAVGLHRRPQPEVDRHRGARHRQPAGEQVPRRHRQQLRQRDPAADLDLHGRRQPEVDGRLTPPRRPVSAASRCTCPRPRSGPRPGRRGRGWGCRRRPPSPARP